MKIAGINNVNSNLQLTSLKGSEFRNDVNIKGQPKKEAPSFMAVDTRKLNLAFLGLNGINVKMSANAENMVKTTIINSNDKLKFLIKEFYKHGSLQAVLQNNYSNGKLTQVAVKKFLPDGLISIKTTKFDEIGKKISSQEVLKNQSRTLKITPTIYLPDGTAVKEASTSFVEVN